MKKLVKIFAGTVWAGTLFLLALILYIQCVLPDNMSLYSSGEFLINESLSLKSQGDSVFSPKIVAKDGTVLGLHFSWGEDAVQPVISMSDRRTVIPGGNPFGIKLRTAGVLIVGMTDIQKGTANVNPAREAGLKVGDVLIEIDGKKISRGDDVKRLITQSGGDSVSVSLLRDGEALSVSLAPVLSEFDQGYRAGMWVRDSSAGIGTMTYYDPESKIFAGLGHAVCDIDTGKMMPLASGDVVDVNISGVSAGASGRPGELKGSFASGKPMGSLYTNCECGLFGRLNRSPISHNPVPMALKGEVKPGPATILSTISGNKPQSFEINIEKVNQSDINPTKNMVIRITDKGLLSATGGIVQGMSGSPILQNGMLVGAVTHVFVNDPTRGYGIFAENMDKQISLLESGRSAA
jgi:stage IV sporulation protein B